MGGAKDGWLVGPLGEGNDIFFKGLPVSLLVAYLKLKPGGMRPGGARGLAFNPLGSHEPPALVADGLV
jgi:hypothetical protein